ncbi:MAG: hypothetical protein IIV78_03300, partial [Oscillospiraceae bacterium]|nr:hypothetical protein [Oscillospiraceae bacterium]
LQRKDEVSEAGIFSPVKNSEKIRHYFAAAKRKFAAAKRKTASAVFLFCAFWCFRTLKNILARRILLYFPKFPPSLSTNPLYGFCLLST